MAHSGSFNFGIALGVASGFTLIVGTFGLFKRWIFRRGPQTGADLRNLVESVNGLTNELRQLRNLGESLDRHLESFLESCERDNSARQAERISSASQEEVHEGEDKREKQAVSITVGVNSDVDDGKESESSEDSEFYEMPSEFPATEDNLNESEVADEETSDEQLLEKFVGEVDELDGDHTHYDENQCRAYTLLTEKRKEVHDHPELLWRQARANVGLSEVKKKQAESDQERKELLYEAVDLSKAAVELDNSLWQAHKWLAITTGSTAEFEGIQKKIQNGYVFKEHIDRALELKGNDPSLWHLLGRWCFEVASLSWWERKGAAALYANPPESTYEQSLEAFIKAEELKPGFWKTNQLMLGKCYVKLGDNSKAKEWLLKARGLAVSTQEDTESHQEVGKLLSTL